MKYFDYEYRVLYGDTDKMGVSYYGNYFTWFEGARNEYFRALGLPYTECEKKGVHLPVKETWAEYHGPSTYDDVIVIRTSVSEFTRTSIRFEYVAKLKGTQKVITSGYSIHVFVDNDKKPCRVPEEVKKIVLPHSLLSDASAISKK